MKGPSSGRPAANPTTPAKIGPWKVACPQLEYECFTPDLHGKFDPGMRQRNVKRILDQIDACFIGTQRTTPPLVRLVLFPEFSLGGWYSAGITVEQYKKHVATTIPGPETDIIARKCIERNIYVAMGIIENDPAWPDLAFNTGIIISPRGRIILKYRKWNITVGANSHDIMDKYVNPITGKNDPFPVVDTGIGRLAVSICADIHFTEMYRVYALKGAEVICHCTAGSPDIRTPLYQARAADNSLYVVVENFAGIILTDGIVDHSRTQTQSLGNAGRSAIYDYEGRLIAQASGDSPQVVIGTIDIDALRARGPSLTNLRTDSLAPYYNTMVFPPNTFLKAGKADLLKDPGLKKLRAKAAEEAARNRRKLYDFYPETIVR